MERPLWNEKILPGYLVIAVDERKLNPINKESGVESSADKAKNVRSPMLPDPSVLLDDPKFRRSRRLYYELKYSFFIKNNLGSDQICVPFRQMLVETCEACVEQLELQGVNPTIDLMLKISNAVMLDYDEDPNAVKVLSN